MADDDKSSRSKTLIAWIGAAAAMIGALGAIGLLQFKRADDRQGQIADRFTRAVAQLGDAALDVRVGGIYALEQVARDATEDRRRMVEILTSYLQEHDRWQPGTAAIPSPQPETVVGPPPIPPTRLRADFQAAVTVLGRRLRDSSSPDSMHLRGVDLRVADLRGAHLEGADLSDAHLEGANLTGAHLKGAHLEGTHLEGAFLRWAHLEHAHLRDAHLERALLKDAYLEGADLAGVVGMTRAQLESTTGTPAKR